MKSCGTCDWGHRLNDEHVDCRHPLPSSVWYQQRNIMRREDGRGCLLWKEFATGCSEEPGPNNKLTLTGGTDA